ncbi:response regulator [Cellulosilyticum lentocellum]|uniref:Stage 0 sporulation protein A homolog n=1 Tax=Cellulosilyticum lentocellum (strain ATCC 49066 / DSM 5427 / NCIMB 11756 / RHM5) TaxID=642492 RepID=F2JIC7_CELLD|nr:response regulator [Cellulosilyticum lentocellum]ADZ84293.1 two component transcriptional regulator, AraC family [Cellulosilyticum lentocellum DSM 5427]
MERLKVILIDDETLIRKLLRMKIDWEALGMEVVTEFSSSKKALEEVQEWNPDIIITDICMPGIDGIEFSETCINLMPKVKIIILTGHDEFNYAMRSIKIGVSDYILKPIKAEVITQTLWKTREKIEKEKNYQVEYEKLAAQIEENLPLFQEGYLNQVLLEPVTSEVFSRKMKFYQVDIHPNAQEIQVALVEMNQVNKENIGNEEDQNEMILHMKARKLIEEFFSGDAYILFCRDGFGRIVIMSNNPDLPLNECLELLRKMLITRLKCYISIGVSCKKEDYSQISTAYKEAVEALNYKMVEGENCIIYYGDLATSTSYLSVEQEKIWKEIKIYVSAGRKEEAEKSVQRLWEHFIRDKYKSTQQTPHLLIEIISWCFNEAIKNDLPIQKQFSKKLCQVYEDPIEMVAFRDEILKYIGMLTTEIAAKDEKKNSSLVQGILNYMLQNLSSPELSMNQVADQFYISAGYLGRLLKKNTGKTYGEYLSEIRFQKAKDLLITTELKAYEIGEAIGICDPHYLSIWFKKMSGDSLSEFRRKGKVQKMKVY